MQLHQEQSSRPVATATEVALDASGNSLLGLKALEAFVARTGLSIF